MRNSEDNYGQDTHSKRFTSPGRSYSNSARQQQSGQGLSPYQYSPYRGNFSYNPPQWSQRFFPPPPSTPPPGKPPPPMNFNRNQVAPVVFDLTKPPPPIIPNLPVRNNGPANGPNHMGNANNRLNQPRMGNSHMHSNMRNRGSNFRNPQQLRQRSSFIKNSGSGNAKASNTSTENSEIGEEQILVNRKAKRKPMSARYTRMKEWDRADAEKALELEREYNKMQSTPMLILKFPDPDLNKHIVKKYSAAIETVHFQQPSTPRYCFVTLKDGSDLEKVRQELCEIPFGTGKIIAEEKISSNEEIPAVSPTEIDPYTLYIGNLPTKVCVKTVKEHFPGAARIDIGYAQRMKYTRYAFIRYNNVETAMEAYKRTFNTLIGNRSLIVRFRRTKGNIGMPGVTRPSQLQNKKMKMDETVVKEQTHLDDSTYEASSNNPKPPNEKKNKNANYNSEDFDEDELEEEDSKQNVIREARKMMTEIPHSQIEHINIKQEKEDDEYERFSNNRNNSNNEIPPNFQVTRIKEEIIDDDELLACARTYNMDEELDYDEPEEEDDYPGQVNSADTAQPRKKNVESVKNRFISEYDEDIKPDFATLPPIPFPSSSFSNYNQSKFDSPYFQKQQFAGPSSILKDGKTTLNKKISSKPYGDDEEEDDDELFNNMNAVDDYDGVNEF